MINVEHVANDQCRGIKGCDQPGEQQERDNQEQDGMDFSQRQRLDSGSHCETVVLGGSGTDIPRLRQFREDRSAAKY